MRYSLLLLMGFAATVSQAQEVRPEHKDWLFLGAEIGYLGVSSGVSGEVSKTGFEAGGKISGSHYFDQYVVDLGAGYLYSHVTGQGLGLVKNLEVTTRSFFAELSPRYRLSPNWQLGPVLQLLAGTDVSYDESEAINERSTIWRILLDVEFGFSFGRQPAALPPVAHTQAPVEAVANPHHPSFAEGRENQIRIYLGEAVLSFAVAKHDMNPKARESLAKLAPLLKESQNSWGHIRVEGHTDSRGSTARNLTLSKQRAGTVADRLIELGISKEKITIAGFGPAQPIDAAPNQDAYRLNRRVEIWLDDVPAEKVPGLVTQFNRLDL